MFGLLTEDYGYGDGMEKAWMKTTSLNGTDKTELVTVNGRLNARRYCVEIIISVVIPVLQGGRADILQQNNARCHVVRHTMLSPFTAEKHLDTRLASACD